MAKTTKAVEGEGVAEEVTPKPAVKKEVAVSTRESARKRLLAVYKSEEKVERAISPLYQPYLGRVIQISLNGITIAFPVDGTTQKVPQSFADEVDSRVMAVDATLNKAAKMSDVHQNLETYAGELQMF